MGNSLKARHQAEVSSLILDQSSTHQKLKHQQLQLPSINCLNVLTKLQSEICQIKEKGASLRFLNTPKYKPKQFSDQKQKVKREKIHFRLIEETLLTYDKNREKSLQLVPEYICQCLSHMLIKQKKQHSLGPYMKAQPQLSEKSREMLIGWIIQIHKSWKMDPQTLFATVMIIDKYLSKKQVKLQKFQLLGATAFYISAKYQETYSIPSIDVIIRSAGAIFSKKQMVEMEYDIVNTLNFELIMDTSIKFFQIFSKIHKTSIRNIYLCQCILELTLLDVQFLVYKPSFLASCVVYLANKIRKRGQFWPKELSRLTSYQEKDFRVCERQLCKKLLSTNNAQAERIKAKYLNKLLKKSQGAHINKK